MIERASAPWFPVPLSPRRGGRPDAFLWIWLFGYEIGYFLLKAFVRFLFRPLFRVRRVVGSEDLPPGGVILAANHQSYLDPALVQLAVRRRVIFVMTADFYRSEKAGWFFRLVGAIPVGWGRMAHGGVRRAAALLRRGEAIVLFPEGRLSLDGSPNPPQRGVAILARRGRVPVVPVGIEGSLRAWPRGAKWLRLADIRLAVGDPVRFEGEATRETEQAFADLVMSKVADLRRQIPPRRP